MKYFKLWRKYKIRVLYKSGNSQVIACDSFSYKWNGNDKEVKWENAKPRPLLIGIGDIEAVYQL